MAKVLFVIRLPAHEADLKSKENPSLEHILQDEREKTEDKNENCKRTTDDNEIPDTINSTEDATKTSDASDDNKISDVVENPDWNFGDPHESEGSANANANGVNKEYDEDSEINEQETDFQSNDFDPDVESETLSDKSKDEKEEKNLCSLKSTLNKEVDKENMSQSGPEYVRFVSEETTLLERAKSVLERMNITGVQWSLTEDNIHMGMFIADDGAECEEILNRLSVIRIGIESKSSISIFPATISIASVQKKEQAVQLQDQLQREDKLEEKVEEFKKTIKSKLVIQQVITNVEGDAIFSFDYLMLIVLASLVALMGLLEASSVVLVASMLISPLMGPILAGVLGTVIRNTRLLRLGIKSELKGLGICIAVGFIVGLIPAGLEVAQLNWRSSDSWPTIEMSSRGALRSLPVGVLIAIPSGAGVALSVLGGKVGSLVGVAISASLLPPAVNAGLLWANAVLVAFVPPSLEKRVNVSRVFSNDSLGETEERYGYAFGTSCPSLLDNTYSQHYFCNMVTESVVLGLVSLFLTILNILCIIVMGVFVLKIKEVAPLPSAPDVEQEFYCKTLKVARDSYQTTKGESSLVLRDKFMQEYKAFKKELGILNEEIDETEEELDKIMEAVEKSAEVNEILQRFPRRSNQRSSYRSPTDSDSASHLDDRPYKTVNLGRKIGGKGDHQFVTGSDVELRQLRRRKSDQSLPTIDLTCSENIASENIDSDSSYFTIHRYIPPGQLRSGLMSPRSISSDGLYPKFAIPKVSRFQIAKVPESERMREEGSKSSTAMPTIAEQESMPLVENQSHIPV
ncbi:hypothetical protein EGW08_000130 [Elysia chlorotica]|uniref:DUF389 domain-containing protein n=1 Tax=Elysia chlorotica TaxID=188477 RepID=A0A433UE55_ELYCH|nr:hypothetical protein EGW08_000130 [Elysia chlorotica]